MPQKETVSVDTTDKDIEEKSETVQESDLEEKKGRKSMEKVMVVEGMACGHCKANVEKTLMALEGVTEAVVDLDKKEAVVTMSVEVANEVLTNAVTEAGYTVVSCQ